MIVSTLTSQAIDDVLADTFPASDPPAWTAGIARPAPALSRRKAAATPATMNTHGFSAAEVLVLQPPESRRTFRHIVLSLLAAAGVVSLLALALVAVCTAIALGMRVVLAALGLVVG